MTTTPRVSTQARRRGRIYSRSEIEDGLHALGLAIGSQVMLLVKSSSMLLLTDEVRNPFERVTIAEIALRVNYMASIFWSSICLLIMLCYPFNSGLLNPILLLVGDFPAPPEYLEQMRREYGLDQPVWVQLWRYLAKVAQGDFGFSFAAQQPVAALIADLEQALAGSS